jgi:hypothetical protein
MFSTPQPFCRCAADVFLGEKRCAHRPPMGREPTRQPMLPHPSRGHTHLDLPRKSRAAPTGVPAAPRRLCPSCAPVRRRRGRAPRPGARARGGRAGARRGRIVGRDTLQTPKVAKNTSYTSQVPKTPVKVVVNWRSHSNWSFDQMSTLSSTNDQLWFSSLNWDIEPP